MPTSRVQSVLDAYTAETGRKVRLIPGNTELSLQSFENIRTLPAADLYLAPSLADLWYIAEMDGFRPTYSASIEANIPSNLRDPESRWTALATSVRYVVHNSELVSTDELADVNNYAALGLEQWRGKLCLSSSSVPGNRTLVAFLIRQSNLRQAEITVRQWRANLATDVFDDDASLLKAISTGRCALGIAGSSALAAHIAADAGAAVALHRFADPAEMVVDVSGGGVTRHAHNPGDAADLLAWLTTNAADALYAALGQEFPANADSAVIPGIESWRDTISRPVPLSALAYLHDDAVLLIGRAKYP
jgi:iron(III) transport system substrate-binding protein